MHLQSGSAAKNGKKLFETIGNEFHAHRRHDQTHKPGYNVDTCFAQQSGNGGGQAEQKGGQACQKHNSAEQIHIVHNRRIALSVEDNGTDRSGASQERRTQGDDSHAVTLSRIEFFLFRLFDITHFGVQHGYCHKQNQNTAADPERPHRYPEESQDGLTAEQDNEENDPHGDGSHGSVFVAGYLILIGGQINKDRDRTDRIDNSQQGNKKFKVFADTSCVHNCAYKEF